MAGFPTMKIVNFIKKNAIVLYISLGLTAKLLHDKKVDDAYRFVYSKNDYERKIHIEQLEQHINNSSKH